MWQQISRDKNRDGMMKGINQFFRNNLFILVLENHKIRKFQRLGDLYARKRKE
jgi:hypothetical protein